MKITFKNVGQGDSIVMEWKDEIGEKIGIIDCNVVGKNNPVLDFLTKSRYREIEFIVLSHPHRDHYSGFENLFQYIEEQGIVVKKFAHTLSKIGPDYFKWFEITDDEIRKLERIVEQANILYQRGFIQNFEYPEVNWQIPLAENISLRCLSPSHDEFVAYMDIVRYTPTANQKKFSQAANLLSTVFCLSIMDLNILLTADAEKVALDRILHRHADLLHDRTFCLCQASHHGSKHSYSADFWNKIDTTDNKHLIVSAGQHHQYSHPDYDLIKEFASNGYKIHCTNIVNGMEEYLRYLNTIKKGSIILDTVSEIAEEYLHGSDRIFVIENNNCEIV